MSRIPVWAGPLVALVCGCGDPGRSPLIDAGADAGADGSGEENASIGVLVLLDGLPAPGATVVQGGVGVHHVTGPDGRVLVQPDWSVTGETAFVASHPRARQRATLFEAGDSEVVIELASFEPDDNPEYVFQDPGTPTRRPTTAQCAHCHQTINEQWYASPHRTSALNPIVHDLYAGTAHGFATAEACEATGGTWRTARLPGGGEGERCFVGDGVLGALGCDGTDCAESPTSWGGCADCHAPAINGQLGGRDLLDATGIAHDYGVSCDVCHRVEAVVPGAPPGVGGRLVLHRPSEPASISLGAGGLLPLTFGPSHDVPNPRMGVVQRDHFGEAVFCAGCHDDAHAPLVDADLVDRARWPDGRLPIQSTYEEWAAGPMAPDIPCQACHMPPDPAVANSANLERFPLATIGIQGGWIRPPGAVAGHGFVGPRQPESGMLAQAASLTIDAEVREGWLEVYVTTRNVGAGHAIPTGDPMRHLLLHVEATCDGEPLEARGGDVIPAWGGYVEARAFADIGLPWRDLWPDTDRIVVIEQTDAWRDYVGWGPFGDGTFTPEQRGLRVEDAVGVGSVLARNADGSATFTGVQREGNWAYLVRERGEGEPADLAGAAGFGFARVLADAEGNVFAPSFTAVDVVSDNRLAPQQAFTTFHSFVGCPDPEITARLLYRPWPVALARERGWPLVEHEMASAIARPRQAAAPLPPPPAPAVANGNTVRFELRASAIAPEPWRYAYNEQVPGPELRARVGDTIEVILRNDVPVPTTLHWHGMRVPFGMDGVPAEHGLEGLGFAPAVPLGGIFGYRFVATHPGTFWYHPHFDSAGQVDAGLYGAIVVEDPDDPPVAADLVLVLDDGVAGSTSTGHGSGHKAGEIDPGGGHGDLHAPARLPAWLVNGVEAPTLTIAIGSTRARFVNASVDGYAAIEGAELRVIGYDQGLTGEVELTDRVVLAPGDRVEIEVLSQPDPVELFVAPWSLAGGPAFGTLRPLVTFVSPGATGVATPVSWPARTEPPSPDPGRTDVLWAFGGDTRGDRWLINGATWPDVPTTEVDLGADVIVELRNLSGTEHPFHIHGLVFEVLSRNGIAPTTRRWSDTENLAIRDVLRIRIPADNVGTWMAHCHILPHADGGMMTMLRVLPP